MKPYTHPRDAEMAKNPLALTRTMGKRKKNWKLQAVATVAPHELDGLKVPESDIHDLIEGEVQAAGMPYISVREGLYFWLKLMSGKHWQAMELLAILKDFPDLAIFDIDPEKPWSRCLLLELKRRKGSGTPGQRRLAEAAGGTIAKGYTTAHDALTKFLNYTPKESP